MCLRSSTISCLVQQSSAPPWLLQAVVRSFSIFPLISKQSLEGGLLPMILRFLDIEAGQRPGKKKKISPFQRTRELCLHAVFLLASFALESSGGLQSLFFYTLHTQELTVGNYMTRFNLLATHLETKVAKRCFSLEITSPTDPKTP